MLDRFFIFEFKFNGWLGFDKPRIGHSMSSIQTITSLKKLIFHEGFTQTFGLVYYPRVCTLIPCLFCLSFDPEQNSLECRLEQPVYVLDNSPLDDHSHISLSL